MSYELIRTGPFGGQDGFSIGTGVPDRGAGALTSIATVEFTYVRGFGSTLPWAAGCTPGVAGALFRSKADPAGSGHSIVETLGHFYDNATTDPVTTVVTVSYTIDTAWSHWIECYGAPGSVLTSVLLT